MIRLGRTGCGGHLEALHEDAGSFGVEGVVRDAEGEGAAAAAAGMEVVAEWEFGALVGGGRSFWSPFAGLWIVGGRLNAKGPANAGPLVFFPYLFKYSEWGITNRKFCTRKIACGLKKLAGFAQVRALTGF